MRKRIANVIAVAAVGVMALGAQAATSSSGQPVDSVPPDLQLSGKNKQSLGQGNYPSRACLERGNCPPNVQVKASCGAEPCTARVNGKLTKVRKDELQPMSTDLEPGEKATLALKLTPCLSRSGDPRPLVKLCTQATSQRKEVHKALKEGKKVKANVTVHATDAAGNVATAKRTIVVVKYGHPGVQDRRR